MELEKKFEVISGEKMTISAISPEVAVIKYHATLDGDDCPCGLPQWGQDTAEELESEGKVVAEWLCMCVEDTAPEVDTWTNEDSLKIMEVIKFLEGRVADLKETLEEYEMGAECGSIVDYVEGALEAYEIVQQMIVGAK